jgi:hypothetical protein
MKKLFFIVVISSLCFACSKDDPQELLIKTTEISLYPEDVIQIDAVSDFDITYLLTNTYLANVSATGLVSANKVGTTLVEVSSHDRVIEVPVEVMGRYNLYPDPITDWGISQSDLIEIAGEPDKSYTSSIEYANYSDQAPNIAYLFTPGDSLMCALVIVLETYSDDLVAYMDERFVFDSEEDGMFVCRNAYNEEDVSMLIGVFNGGGGSLMVLYIEYQKEETKSSQSVATEFKNMRKQIKSLASENMNKIH